MGERALPVLQVPQVLQVLLVLLEEELVPRDQRALLAPPDPWALRVLLV